MKSFFENIQGRFVFLCLSLSGSLCAGLFIDLQDSALINRHLGYWVALVCVALFVCYMLCWCKFSVSSCLSPRVALIGAFCALAVGGWWLFVHADFGYKIAMDEYILSSTARSMHESREVFTTLRNEYYGGEVRPNETYLDKRLWLYPFVVSIFHDVVGFSTANTFVVNAVLGLFLLLLSYVVGYQIGGIKAGVCGVFLWVSSPLLAQNATGAGMELLNVVLILSLILMSSYYLKRPTACGEAALSLVAVMLVYTRYESAVFIIPALVIIALGWWKAKRVFLAWGSLLSPLLLICALLHLRIYANTQASWEVVDDGSSVMSVANLIANFPHALNFFFSYDHTLANSLLISALGVVCLVVFVVMLRHEIKRYYKNYPLLFSVVVFAPFFIIHLCVMLSFHAGKLDSPFVSRYSFPFHILLILVILGVVGFIGRRYRKAWGVLMAITFLFIVTFTLPMNAKAIFSKRNFAIREQVWLEELSMSTLPFRAAIVDRFTVPWSLRDWVCYDMGFAQKNSDVLFQAVIHGKYSGLYWVERMHYESDGFVSDTILGGQLADLYETELVAERSFRPYTLTRVYRVLSYKPTVDP